MGTPNNNPGGKSPHQHDGQKNYQNSNQRNPDNIRDNTRDRQYKDYDETLTNDAKYDTDSAATPPDADFNDTKQNVDKNDSAE